MQSPERTNGYIFIIKGTIGSRVAVPAGSSIQLSPTCPLDFPSPTQFFQNPLRYLHFWLTSLPHLFPISFLPPIVLPCAALVWFVSVSGADTSSLAALEYPQSLGKEKAAYFTDQKLFLEFGLNLEGIRIKY